MQQQEKVHLYHYVEKIDYLPPLASLCYIQAALILRDNRVLFVIQSDNENLIYFDDKIIDIHSHHNYYFVEVNYPNIAFYSLLQKSIIFLNLDTGKQSFYSDKKGPRIRYQDESNPQEIIKSMIYCVKNNVLCIAWNSQSDQTYTVTTYSLENNQILARFKCQADSKHRPNNNDHKIVNNKLIIWNDRMLIKYYVWNIFETVDDPQFKVELIPMVRHISFIGDEVAMIYQESFIIKIKAGNRVYQLDSLPNLFLENVFLFDKNQIIMQISYDNYMELRACRIQNDNVNEHQLMKWKGNMAPSIEFQNGNFLVIPIDDEKDEYIETDQFVEDEQSVFHNFRLKRYKYTMYRQIPLSVHYIHYLSKIYKDEDIIYEIHNLIQKSS